MHTKELKATLSKLSTSQLKKLSELSEVGLRTIWKIRSGDTVTAGEGTKDKLLHGLARLKQRERKEQP